MGTLQLQTEPSQRALGKENAKNLAARQSPGDVISNTVVASVKQPVEAKKDSHTGVIDLVQCDAEEGARDLDAELAAVAAEAAELEEQLALATAAEMAAQECASG